MTPLNSNGLSSGWFRPVIDGKAIPAYPTTAIRQGNFFKVPLIVGHVLFCVVNCRGHLIHGPAQLRTKRFLAEMTSMPV